jgi:hypothetical protein
MEFSLITDQPELAASAELAGIDRIMIDLETKGKSERQSGKGLFLSSHRIDAIAKLRSRLTKACLVVRINPLDKDSREEIDRVVEDGANYIMLPYFHRVDQVEAFHDLVGKRAKTILLVETDGAAENLQDILRQSPPDELHIGLNDLSICLHKKLIFELFLDGTVEGLAAMARQHNKPFGVGGIGCLTRTELPVSPLRVFVEQIRLGASRGWLGRSFRENLALEQLPVEVRHLKAALESWQIASDDEFQRNHLEFAEEVIKWSQGEERVSKQNN